MTKGWCSNSPGTAIFQTVQLTSPAVWEKGATSSTLGTAAVSQPVVSALGPLLSCHRPRGLLRGTCRSQNF